MKHALSSIILLLYILPLASFCQEGATPAVTDKVVSLPAGFLSRINAKTADLDKRLTAQTEKYLARMNKEESRLKKKYTKFDSAASAQLFSGDIQSQYDARLRQLKADTGATAKQRAPTGDYLPNVDSLQTSLKFLQQHPDLLASSKIQTADIQSSLEQLKITQAKLLDAEQLSQLLQQRRQQIQNYLSRYTQVPGDITSTFNGYKQQLFYYKQQVKEYKEMLNDPDRLVNKTLQYLNKVPAFSSFMSKNSMLAGLFGLAGGPSPSSASAASPGAAGVGSIPSGPGMPSRDQVLAAFQGQSGISGPNAQSVMQSNVSSATDQAAQSQGKIPTFGNSGGADPDMPDFTPNMQKTKSFLKRLEWGTNLQTVQSSSFFPATSDLALSLGYKLNDNNRIGVGASYKIGWGQNISHIHLTGQGASIRSFADFLIKKNIYASGGFEYNYQQPLATLSHFPSLSNWQSSALFGVSRIVPVKGKLFKSIKMQFLWDALSYQQIPKAPPFKFRVGYSF